MNVFDEISENVKSGNYDYKELKKMKTVLDTLLLKEQMKLYEIEMKIEDEIRSKASEIRK